MGVPRSSRQRYHDYLRGLREFRLNRGKVPPPEGVKSTQRHRSFFRLFREFLTLIRGHRRVMILALGTLTVSTVLGLIPLSATKVVFDYVLGDQPVPAWIVERFPVPQEPRTLLTAVAVAMVLISVTALAFGTWGRWQTTRITKRVQVSVRRKVFEHASRLPLHRVYDLKSGGVASILREDAGGVAELLFSLLYNPWRAIIQLVGSLIILATVDWRLLLGSLALLPTVYLTHRTWISRIRPLFRGVRSTRQKVDSHATEAFGGMRVVRGFNRQRSESATFIRNNQLMTRQEILAWWWMRGVDIAWSILIPTATATLLWYGGIRVLGDRERLAAGLITAQQALTVGDLIMFLSYLAALLLPLEALANSATQFQNNLAGLDRVLDLLEEPTEMPHRDDALHVSRQTVQGRITLEGVGFTYAGTRTPVLSDISLDVAPGEMVALVGPSGAGKTTLCNLIARFYDPTVGRILLDGVDLRDIDVDSYRGLLGIVEQETFLFDGTIADNIGYGRRHATLEEIAHAARLANAHDFISALKDGYHTLIGERGVKLSGGQRQRLSIARALLADPKILILDEATSNLDTESERLIQHSLETLMTGRTCFVIAHRLSTIAHADRIVVLEAGRIVEQGTHAELMARSGRYRRMVELQVQAWSGRNGQTFPPPVESYG